LNWLAITTDDLNDTKVAALVTALRSSALGSGQDDPVEEMIATVTARIRAEVGACPRNQVDSDTTKIPASLKRLGCRMVAFEMMGRLQIELNEDERDERRSDIRLLERIAKCELAIEIPDTPVPAEVQKGSTIEVVTETPRQATRDKLKGL
jgi:phage gp36-like protein